MTRYLLIQSNDPFEQRSVADDYEIVARLAGAGHEVSLFLVQNGVLPARAGARDEGLDRAADGGVRVLADEFSLRERGIPADDLRDGVHAAPLDVVVDAMAEGHRTIWL